MKKTSKALLLMLCAVLLVAASVLGTMAYLTSTDAVTNTFTVGKVAITLDEAKVNPDGSLVYKDDGNTLADRVDANTYHLLPGHTYVKDPTIHVDSKSEDCYLFVKVENGIAAIETTEAGKSVAAQMTSNGWASVENEPNTYVYIGTAEGASAPLAVKASNNIVVFENFTVDGTKVVNVPTGEAAPNGKLDIAQYSNQKITVTAYAIQKDGFESKTAAQIWADAGF